jgi:hypothetical protein
MLRLCSESSRSYPGRSALHALNLFCNNSRLGPYREIKVLASPAVADGDETRIMGIICKKSFHCAFQGNLFGDRAEVSRRHSSQMPGVMSRTR